MIMVAVPSKKKSAPHRREYTFIASKSPAVTRVLECTSALMGVGALIAAGSQTLKGNCALLVRQAKIKRKVKHLFILLLFIKNLLVKV